MVLLNKRDIDVNMKVEIIKRLTSSNGKTYKKNDDIHFILCRNKKEYDCFGVIKDIRENEFDIVKVQIDCMHVSDKLTIKYEEVKDGIIHMTDNSWY